MQKHALAFGGLSLSGLPVNLTLAILRVLAGLSLALGHGMKKMPPSDSFIDGVGDLGFPIPIVFAWMAALSELVGGVLVAAGLLTRPSAFVIMCTMLVAAFLQHGDDPFSRQELPLIYSAVFLLFAVIGAGRISIDALIRKQ